MDDLISRQEALDTARAELDGGAPYDIPGKIEALPSVDAAPVRRGKWIVYVISPFDGEDVKCSECGERGCAPYWDYCPHCGAKNDEVVNEDDN